MTLRKMIDYLDMRQLKDISMTFRSINQNPDKGHLILRQLKRDTIDANMKEEALKEITIEITIVGTIKLGITRIMTTETTIAQASQGLMKER